MTAQDFCYWLQGYMELENPTSINADRTEMIKEHLNLVFNKVTAPQGLKPVGIALPYAPEPGMVVYNGYNKPTGQIPDVTMGTSVGVSC